MFIYIVIEKILSILGHTIQFSHLWAGVFIFVCGLPDEEKTAAPAAPEAPEAPAAEQRRFKPKAAALVLQEQRRISTDVFIRASCCLKPSSQLVASSPGPRQTLDFEKKPSYTVEIQVQNTQTDPRFVTAGSRDVATVRIGVEDVDEPPLFDKSSYLVEAKEDAAVGVAVGSVSAMDPDGARSTVK